jgi:hypothetical protein
LYHASLLGSALLAGTVVAVALVPAGEGPGSSPAAARAEAERLVRDLASPDFRAREAAARNLRDLGEQALPALRAGRASGSAEARRRCEQLIEQIAARAEERQARAVVERVTARWRGRDVRRFLVRLGRGQEPATPERLRDAWELGEYAAARASQIGGRPFRLPPLEVGKLTVARQHDSFVKDTALLTANPGRVTVIWGCLVVSSDGLLSCNAIRKSVVLVGGDVGRWTSIDDSVIVCLGKVGGVNSVRNSVVLATGHLTGFNSAANSFFEVEGIGSCNTSDGNVYLNLKKLPGNGSTNDIFPAGPGPLQLFRPPDRPQPGTSQPLRKE